MQIMQGWRRQMFVMLMLTSCCDDSVYLICDSDNSDDDLYDMMRFVKL